MAYEVAGAFIEAGDIIVSSFNSWRGQFNPSGAFVNENGNRLHFGLHIVGDGTQQFRLNVLCFEIESTDPEIHSISAATSLVLITARHFEASTGMLIV